MSKYELYIMQILLKENIKFERELGFSSLKNGRYRFDFYINMESFGSFLLEIDGEQHFKQIKRFQKTKSDFQKQQEHDRQKNSFCLANNIILYRIPYWEIYNIKSFSDIMQDKFLVRSKWHNDYLVN